MWCDFTDHFIGQIERLVVYVRLSARINEMTFDLDIWHAGWSSKVKV